MGRERDDERRHRRRSRSRSHSRERHRDREDRRAVRARSLPRRPASGPALDRLACRSAPWQLLPTIGRGARGTDVALPLGNARRKRPSRGSATASATAEERGTAAMGRGAGLQRAPSADVTTTPRRVVRRADACAAACRAHCLGAPGDRGRGRGRTLRPARTGAATEAARPPSYAPRRSARRMSRRLRRLGARKSRQSWTMRRRSEGSA